MSQTRRTLETGWHSLGRKMALGLWPSHGSRFGWVLAHSCVFSQPKMNRFGPPWRGQGLLSYPMYLPLSCPRSHLGTHSCLGHSLDSEAHNSRVLEQTREATTEFLRLTSACTILPPFLFLQCLFPTPYSWAGLV